jgi:hypothetical protein
VLGKSRIVAQVAERRLDVVCHRSKSLKVRQGIGGVASVLVDGGLQLAHVPLLHIHHAAGEMILPGVDRTHRHDRADDPDCQSNDEQEQITLRIAHHRGRLLLGFAATIPRRPWPASSLDCRHE